MDDMECQCVVTNIDDKKAIVEAENDEKKKPSVD
jgi:hypothetical protein